MAEHEKISRILEQHKIPSGNQLRRVLTTAADPLLAIKTFQDENDVKMPNLEPIFKILEIHQVRRAEFYEAAVHDLTERTCSKLRQLGESKTPEAIGKLEAQLAKSFNMYELPRIRPVVLETLKQLPRVPSEYLERIVADEQLYCECAINVRQQIWLKHEDLFVAAVAPVVDAYLTAKAKIINTVDMSTANFFTHDTVKSRRQYPQIAELLSITGDRPELFARLNAYLKKKFTETDNNHYCSLRLEYTMAAKEQNIESIVKADLAQDFACCLDACLRDKHMDAQQNNRLKMIIEGKRRASPKVIAELAMVAADSHIIHFIGCIASKVLRDMANHMSHVPRDHQFLPYLLKILHLGLNAVEIIAEEQAMPGTNVELTTKFLPGFVRLIAEDIARAEISKASAEFKEEHIGNVTSPVPEDVKKFITHDRIAAFLWLHYSWNLFPIKNRIPLDMTAILRYIDQYPQLCDKVTYRDPWVHLIAHRLLVSSNLNDIMGDNDFIKCFFESYLLQDLESEPCVKYQVLRLCNLLHHHMGEELTRAIMEPIDPERLAPSIPAEMKTSFEVYASEFRRVEAKVIPQPVEEPTPLPANFPPTHMGFPLSHPLPQATYPAPEI